MQSSEADVRIVVGKYNFERPTIIWPVFDAVLFLSTVRKSVNDLNVSLRDKPLS